MISTFDIMVAKEDHGIGKLIYVTIGKRDFLFRQLSIKEYIQCNILTDTTEGFNEAICQLALVHCFDPQFMFDQSPIANIPDICAKEIIHHSYIKRPADTLELLEVYRERVKGFNEQVSLLIKSAFPEFPIEEIENWGYDKSMSYLAKAEFILNLKLGRSSENQIKLEGEVLNEEDIEKETDADLAFRGVDLVMHYGKELSFRKSILEIPVILGIDWRDDGSIELVRQQIYSR